MEYTDINSEEDAQQLDLKTYNLTNLEEDESIIESQNISDDLTESEEEESCEDKLCNCENLYGCKDLTGYFVVDNLFSELTSNYQRALARLHLGIADEYSLLWGNINGNLENQKDLYTFVQKLIGEKVKQYLDNIDIGSGTNTNNLKYLTVTPSYMYFNDDPTTIIVSWDYSKDITSLYINDIKLDNTIRSYTINNVSQNTTITLKYVYNDLEYSKSITFNSYYPIYYGTSNDYTKLLKTISSSFTVTSSKDLYIYILVPRSKSVNFSVNGFVGGFIQEDYTSISNVAYTIYRSKYANLGTTLINVISV